MIATTAASKRPSMAKRMAVNPAQRASTVSAFALYQLLKGRLVIKLSRHMDWRPDWTIIRSLFRFGLPTGVQLVGPQAGEALLLQVCNQLEQALPWADRFAPDAVSTES